MRRFAALPWGRNWAPAAPLAEVGRRSGGLRGGLADAGRADRQAWAGASPAVTDGLWSVRGRVLDWLLEPLPGTPRCCCVRVCQSRVLILGLRRRLAFPVVWSEPLQEAGRADESDA